jgi:hypothetical protein
MRDHVTPGPAPAGARAASGQTGRRPVRPRLVLVPAVLATALLFFCAAAPSAAQARSVLRGLFDNCFVGAAPQDQQRVLTDMAVKLHVQVVRIDLHWEQLEPTAPGEYDTAYQSMIVNAVDAAKAAGLKVMIDIWGVPRWASDQSYWDAPPGGYSPGYQQFYPIAADKLIDWQNTARYVATLFKGKVAYWECWNEPNLWIGIYPQTKPGDMKFSARVYFRYLQHFVRGVRAGDPAAKVLGGVTAPFGRNNTANLSPQRFARNLKSLGAEKWWDGYSHHPYLPATRPMRGPLAAPRLPYNNVTLSNIETLLKLFPKSAFYLTEYGYPTKRSPSWGYGSVSEKLQARYLTVAYKEAAAHRQIKMLTWFLWKDIVTDDPDSTSNAYFGLRRPDGTRKPAWYAYGRLR